MVSAPRPTDLRQGQMTRCIRVPGQSFPLSSERHCRLVDWRAHTRYAGRIQCLVIEVWSGPRQAANEVGMSADSTAALARRYTPK